MIETHRRLDCQKQTGTDFPIALKGTKDERGTVCVGRVSGAVFGRNLGLVCAKIPGKMENCRVLTCDQDGICVQKRQLTCAHLTVIRQLRKVYGFVGQCCQVLRRKSAKAAYTAGQELYTSMKLATNLKFRNFYE